jgi:hypothetical protein
LLNSTLLISNCTICKTVAVFASFVSENCNTLRSFRHFVQILLDTPAVSTYTIHIEGNELKLQGPPCIHLAIQSQPPPPCLHGFSETVG